MNNRFGFAFTRPAGAVVSYELGDVIKDETRKLSTKAQQKAYRCKQEEERDDPHESVKLKSGRYIRANCGIVGLSPDLTLYDGYDSSIDVTRAVGGRRPRPLTRAEKRELADIMIKRWRAFKKNPGK